MSGYLTDFGRDGRGEGVNEHPRLALQYTHDIFLRAASDHLDIFMICESLRDSLRSGLYDKVTGHTFVESVEEVLRAGNDVSILVWSERPADYDVPVFRALAARARHYAGRLAIRASGTSDGRERITDFIVAKSRNDSRWIVRVEQPHAEIVDAEIEDETFRVPAAVVFTSAQAQKHGLHLMTIFNKLFNAMDDCPVLKPVSLDGACT